MNPVRLCTRCGNELGLADEDLCTGCQNELAGRCRWCGLRPPQHPSELCGECESSAELVEATGSFAGATAPNDAGTLRLAITRSQLGDLRDGHLVCLRSAEGERAQLTLGTVKEVHIEALAAGRPAHLHLVIDDERTPVTITPATGSAPAGSSGR